MNGLPYPVLVELGISDDMLVPGQNQCRCHLILCNQVPEAVTSLALNPRPTPAMRERARNVLLQLPPAVELGAEEFS